MSGAGPNWAAIAMFALFVALTLVITGWAARRTKTRADFYAAGGGVSGSSTDATGAIILRSSLAHQGDPHRPESIL